MFKRVRIGIGAPSLGISDDDFVLSAFGSEEKEEVPDIMERAMEKLVGEIMNMVDETVDANRQDSSVSLRSALKPHQSETKSEKQNSSTTTVEKSMPKTTQRQLKSCHSNVKSKHSAKILPKDEAADSFLCESRSGYTMGESGSGSPSTSGSKCFFESSEEIKKSSDIAGCSSTSGRGLHQSGASSKLHCDHRKKIETVEDEVLVQEIL